MAVKGAITLNEILIYEIDADPSVEGLSAPSGSLGIMTDGSALYLKGEGNQFDWLKLSPNTLIPNHSDLFGLSNDDHLQYLNEQRGDTRYYTKTQSDTNFEPKNINIQTHISSTENPHNVTKAQVGLGNVPNVDATSRANHTGTQLSSTISDFETSAQNAVISQSIVNNDITHAPSVDAVHDALAAEELARIAISDRVTDIENDYGVAGGLATLDNSGKISTSMLPGTVLEYKGVWDASTNTPTLQNGSLYNAQADAGHIYRVAVAGTVNFGSGNITFYIGDDVILSESLQWQRAPGGSLVVSVNGFQGDVTLDSEDIQLTSPVAGASDVQHALENVNTSISTTMTNHVEALDPHPQYETSTEVQSKVDAHANRIDNPHLVTKSQVGLGNVPNIDATLRSNHTGTQLASTISDFTTAVQAVTIDAAKIDGGVVSNAEFATLDGITTGVSIQSQIDGKQPTITGAATTITSSNLSINKALQSDANGKVSASTVTSTELGYVSGVTSSIQAQLNAKQISITGAATTILSTDLSANKALQSDTNGKVAASTVTSTELGYLSGVTSAIQTQITNEVNARSAEDLTFLKLNGSRSMTGDLKTIKQVKIPQYTVATTNGTLTLTSASYGIQFVTETTTTSGYSIVLPDATTLQNGCNFELYNRTSNPITVKYNSGATLGSLSKESVSSLILQDNTTQNGVWSPFTIEIAQQAAGVINYTLEQTTPFSTTSATDAQITTFILTPQSGQYFISVNATVACSGNNATNYISLYKNTTQQIGTERSSLASGNNTSFLLTTQGVISVNGTDQIRVYVRTIPASGAAPTLTVNNRSIVGLRLGPSI